MGNAYARIKPSVAEPRPLRSREAHVRPVRIASRRLADENPLFGGLRNLMRCVPGRLTRGAHLWCTSSTHRLPAPCGREPTF